MAGTDKRPLRETLNEIIFGYETRAGRLFDVVLIIVILLSVAAVLLDSVQPVNARFHQQLYVLEWAFTLVFTVEYALRLWVSSEPGRYARSFFGLVDLFSILPTYIAFLFPAASYLIVLRILRALRIFRVLKLIRYVGEANVLVRALVASRRKIFVFLFAVLNVMVIFGSVMFVVEGPQHGFASIPVSIYWSIVTITTVGYGDIAPQTEVGRLIASLAMITGYAIIAVPTGIVSAELMNEFQNQRRQETHDYSQVCGACGRRGHERDSVYCRQCGAPLLDDAAKRDRR